MNDLSVKYKGDLVSRFFRTSDESWGAFANFSLPIPWWSRRYEYPWAATFAESNHSVLDAACGISHPFKFWLADKCLEAFACDLDPRINDDAAIQQDVKADFGIAMDLRGPLAKLKRREANITELMYADKSFDRVFCISVLEHMTREDMLKALKEFKRVLKPDGLIILTFDVPTISTAMFVNIVQASGLWFAGEFDPQRFKDIVSTNMYGGLSCFRAVLK